MIWDSILVMTAIDLAILGVVGYASFTFASARGNVVTLRTRTGLATIILGLSLTALFYLADLVAMHVLPLYMPTAEAMGLMRDLHLNYRWPVTLLGVGCVAFGLATVGRNMSSLLEKLLKTERDLRAELARRKESEQALQESQFHLTKAQSLAKIGHWRWSIGAGDLEYCSEEFARIHGMTKDNIRALMKEQMSRVIHPDDRERVAERFRAFDKSGLSYEIDYQIVRPDGEVRHVLELGEPVFDSTGRAIAHTGTIQDITESQRTEKALRESKERLKGALEQARLAYWWYSFSLNAITEWSAEAATILGIPRERLPTDFQTYLESVHPDDRKRLARIYRIEEPKNPDRRNYEVEYRYCREDGKTVWLRETGEVVHDASDTPLGYQGTIQDISETKLTEERLRQAQKMEAVGQLTGGVAHDFNNLLAIMIGNAEMLEGNIGDNEKAQHHIEAVKRAVDRASFLTNRLLAFSRQTALSPVAANVSDLIGGLHDMLQRTLGEAIDLRVEDTPDLWPATIDPHQFENALINLAVNARDAMPQGGTLTIETANVTLDETYAEQHEELKLGDCVEVAVSDTGTGMSPEVLEKAFEPFFTTKEVGKGSGLGLSMVYGFAKQSKGHVAIYSEPGHGTTTKLYLPRSQESAAKRDTRETEDDTHEFERGSERILVVEDDESVREVPATILREQGYEVVEAGDGEEALKHLKDDQPFDILLTDVVLPSGMNGVEIAKQAKRLRPNIRVLYTTGYAENAVLHNGELDPGVTLVNKPYRRAELLEKIRLVMTDAA